MKHSFRYKVETEVETGIERKSSENEEARRVAGFGLMAICDQVRTGSLQVVRHEVRQGAGAIVGIDILV